MRSTLWETGNRRAWPVLRGREKADVAIAGGGLTGLSCALWLSRVGLKVTLLEARQIGWGASGRCAGAAVYLNRMMAADLERSKGIQVLDAYVHTQKKALEAIRELSQTFRFGWQNADVFLYAEDTAAAAMLECEAESLKKAGAHAVMEKPVNAPVVAQSVLRLSDMGLLHSSQYLQVLAEAAMHAGAQLYGMSRVIGVETNRLYSEQGSVEAPYIIIATGYPVINVPGWYFLRMEQRRELLLPLTGGTPFDGLYLSADGRFGLRALYKGALLHVAGNRAGQQETAIPHDLISSAGMEIAPEWEHGMEAYTEDGLPFIGTYGGRTPNLFVASGYGGRGIVGSMTAAQAISARILGLPSEGYEIYSGQRKMERPSFAARIAARSLKGWMHGAHAPRCSHLGCRLVYNPRQRLWECPCHGSRFDDLGQVINAPAVMPARLGKRK